MSQKSGAVWGPGRDSLFLLSSLLLHPPGHSLVLQKLGCHLLAQACPCARAGALTETSVVPAVILVVWRSGHGYVRAGNTGRYFCAFPSISLKIKPVTIDSLRISQKQRESSFISSSLASGHFWMHDKCITAFFAWQRAAPISDRGPIVPSVIQTSNTEVRQHLGKSAILFWFVSLPLTCKPFPIRPRWQIFISCIQQGVKIVIHLLPIASPPALHLLPAHIASWHPPAVCFLVTR